MNDNKVDIKLLQTIICDDVRQEVNGKFLLIGMYSDGIYMRLPSDIIISLWMQFEIEVSEKFSLEFEIIGNCLREPVRFVIPVVDKKLFMKKQLLPVIAKLPLRIIRTGHISIYYKKSGDGKMYLAKEVPIIITADVPQTALGAH